MRKRISIGARTADSLRPLALLVAMAVLVTATGCDEPDNDEGTVISTIDLPSDILLDLACADVGINAEPCILQDPDNPYRTTTILEFQENNPDAPNKFTLQGGIPGGSSGAKARFYLWATALARFPSGENQFFTAQALHELYTASNDPIIRDQALRAYQSMLDNFFGSVVFFTCCGEFFSPPRDDVAFSVPLNELTIEALVYPGDLGFAPLVPEDPTGIDAGLLRLLMQEFIAEWGYTYQCQSDTAPHDCFVSVNEF